MRRFLLAVLTLTAPLGATVLYSDFGAGDSYNTATGWTLSNSGSPISTTQAVAAEFQPSVTATLDSIRVAAFWVSGTDSFTLELAADNSGAPGTILEGYTLTPTASTSILTATSLSNPTLSAGTNYWLIILPGAADTWGAWNENSQSVDGVAFSTDNGTTWSPLLTDGSHPAPAFDVSGTPDVPEPTSEALLLSGIGLLGFLKFRKAWFLQTRFLERPASHSIPVKAR